MKDDTEAAYFAKNPSDPATLLPPLDGRWYVADGYSYMLHPAQQAFAKYVKIAAEQSVAELPSPDPHA